jgi:hypothetical protein
MGPLDILVEDSILQHTLFQIKMRTHLEIVHDP